MSFISKQTGSWKRGTILAANPDAIPDDSLRLAKNLRLDRTLGNIEPRPGWTARTATAFTNAITSFTRLFGLSTTYGYVQEGGILRRTNSSWASPTLLATPGGSQLSSANSPDGHGTPWVYFVNASAAIKDNGTLTQNMGIQPPTAPPLAAALATDLFTQIDQMDAAASWAGTNTSAITDDTAIFQETPSSITYTIAASLFGSVASYPGAAINLDTLTGGDPLVKNDDYIFLWVRVDRPERVTYLQLDIDIDSATTGVADAFRRNYYTVRLPSLTRLSQGIGTWSKLQVRKSEFTRFGTDTARSWANARALRIGILTNAQGAITVNLDDYKLRGGIGLEGEISYTVTYQNSVTGSRSNPPLDSDRVLRFTAPLIVDRQRVSLDTTNVIEGGVDHPTDIQVDKIQIWRKGGTFPEAVKVDTISDTAASPYIDNTSDETLVLTNLLLETDNDVLPSGSSRVLFGPDATGHFFCIIDGYRLHASKPYEANENRVENWPHDSFSLIGDGSTKALTGLATATQTLAWTTAQTFKIVGIGAETFLPVAIEGSRGITSRNGITSGNNTIFFVASDGIYAQRGDVQVKLTGAIDPFFQGTDLEGLLGITAGELSAVWLEFFPHPSSPMLVMLYGTSKALVLKPGSQSNELTECFFDTHARTNLNALFFDEVNRELLAGATNGHVYKIEDSDVFSDAGTAIAFQARTKSENFDATSRAKFVAQAVIEGNTHNQVLSITSLYDRNTVIENLPTVFSNAPTALMQIPLASSRVLRHDISLDISCDTRAALSISRIGYYVELQPERVSFLDSGDIPFEFVAQNKRLLFDMNAPTDVTLEYFADGVLIYEGTLLHTLDRANINHPLPPGMRGRIHRLTCRSTEGFLPYSVAGWFKALGSNQGYTEKPMIQAV